MLDGLLNRGFSSKCKSSIKATRTRIEVVRRRAEAKQRFQKEDLAKLLANGLDINAYGRTEEFLAGLNLLSCYDFIEQSCDYVVKNLSSMQKQRECPEECREAVASLMFAAARFSDLPELRDVRDLFQERYGSSFECFVNKKFVEKLSSRPPIMEKKIQLLQDIALEFSLKWDSRGFEQRMIGPSTPAQAQANKYGHSNVAADKCNLLNGNGNVAKSDKDDVLPKEMPIHGNIGHRMHREGNDLRREELDLHLYGRKERSAIGHKQPSYKGESAARNHDDILFHERDKDRVGKHDRWVKKDSSLSKVEKSNSSSNRKRLDSTGIVYTGQDDIKNDIYKRESRKALSPEKINDSPSFGGISGKNEDVLFAGKHGGIPGKNGNIHLAREHGSSQNEVNLPKKVQEVEVDGMKSYHSTPRPPPYVKSKSNAIPPPYVKPNDSKPKTTRRSEHAGSYDDGRSLDPLPHNRVDKVNGSDWVQKELAYPVHEGQINGSTRLRSHEKEQCYQDDKIPLPKPRSVRRKHHKSSSSHNDVSHVEDAGSVKRNSSSRRRDHSRKGLQILVDYEHYRKAEEEKMIDKLLLHYSKKPSAYDDVGSSRKTSEAHPSHQGARDTGETSQDQDTDGNDAKTKIIAPPTRCVSLPHEQSAPSEAKKTFTRANSFQPDSQAPHVHPKLPDYDDLAARFAALKGR